jgi:hypothetical protein
VQFSQRFVVLRASAPIQIFITSSLVFILHFGAAQDIGLMFSLTRSICPKLQATTLQIQITLIPRRQPTTELHTLHYMDCIHKPDSFLVYLDTYWTVLTYWFCFWNNLFKKCIYMYNGDIFLPLHVMILMLC